mmetsp:Transcript_89421/g.257968  ORF Transcript_89421/g.257968 Transcript_89421/m.257968 type:complete len:273 (-) Transcript_89421:55-873(-)
MHHRCLRRLPNSSTPGCSPSYRSCHGTAFLSACLSMLSLPVHPVLETRAGRAGRRRPQSRECGAFVLTLRPRFQLLAHPRLQCGPKSTPVAVVGIPAEAEVMVVDLLPSICARGCNRDMGHTHRHQGPNRRHGGEPRHCSHTPEHRLCLRRRCGDLQRRWPHLPIGTMGQLRRRGWRCSELRPVMGKSAPVPTLAPAALLERPTHPRPFHVRRRLPLMLAVRESACGSLTTTASGVQEVDAHACFHWPQRRIWGGNAVNGEVHGMEHVRANV